MIGHPRILALDPGITTGWAYIAPFNIQTGVITYNESKDQFPQNHLRNALISLRQKWTPQMIVIERMPLRLEPNLRAVVETCEEVFPTHHLIAPGEWKPVAKIVKLPFSPSTQHQKDAYRMGRFYLYKFWNEPLV